MEVKLINQEREVQFLTDIDGVVWLKVFASLYVITDWMVRKQISPCPLSGLRLQS